MFATSGASGGKQMGALRSGIQAILAMAVAMPLLANCSTVPDVDPDNPGVVSGKLMVFWVAEDKFVYYPYFGDPLKFKLPADLAAKYGTDTIRPGAIYTDGGSIPKGLRSLAGFSPWGYGPAYIVHDWLFEAHRCVEAGTVDRLDERDREEAARVSKVDFDMSADILAAVVFALAKQEKVPRRGLAPNAIYTGVDSAIAERLWNSGPCAPVDPKYIAEIERDLRRKSFESLAVEPARTPDDGPVLVYQQAF